LVLFRLSGGEFEYAVQPGDSLTRIGSRFGVDVATLAAGNAMEPSAILHAGRILKIDNRHIVPEPAGLDDTELIVNVPQRMLFLRAGNAVVHAMPIAAGSRRWKTPLGQFSITVKETDPVWDVPLSIQEEMRRAGKPVITRVPPSPENPLGKYWLGLSIKGIGIHGTNVPLSIYSHPTHGCIRVHPDEIGELFENVQEGTRGQILYEPVLILRHGDTVFLEVHPDIYRIGGEPMSIVLEQARAGGFTDLLDLARVREVVSKRDGIARDVTRQSN
jgi:L,D-transpeptidase ErfK/SrfK